MSISTHVLDASTGRPARAITVTLDQMNEGQWTSLGSAATNDDGRCPELTEDLALTAGAYRIRFDTGAYFAGRGVETFYPFVEILFVVNDADAHHHVPLLLSPFAYSTYRGS